ncbi:hypothetical protein [Pseudomonas sp. NY15374]|uniref:hypothetical protein n=1 Tax=Pseudomonas sp. NY15374 TaxID=3400357 RepID=UPI003A86ECDF
MALQQVNLGTPPSALDGDDPRTAFTRINNNFQFLDTIGVSAPIGRPVPNDDCNLAMTEGWWNAASGSAANRPPNMTFILIHVVTVGGYVVQHAVDMFSGRRAGRAFNVGNSTWSVWGREVFLTDLGTAAFANILGTVSSSGGVPTGAIMEAGSNANGRYVKFADGTMICTSAGVNIQTPSFPANSVSNTYAVNLPAAYAYGVFTPFALVGPNASNDHYGVTNCYPSSGSQFTIIVRNGGVAQNFVVRYITIGRWL